MLALSRLFSLCALGLAASVSAAPIQVACSSALSGQGPLAVRAASLVSRSLLQLCRDVLCARPRRVRDHERGYGLHRGRVDDRL